jgi:hypothetical protein
MSNALDAELALISQNRRLKARPLTITLANLPSLVLETLQQKTRKTYNEIIEEAILFYAKHHSK